MTSVLKLLKFLQLLYPDLQTLYEKWPPSEDKIRYLHSLFADILSVLAMTYSDTQPCGTLCYCLLSASLRSAGSPLADPGTWGHEYVCHLATELGDEYTFHETEADLPMPTSAPEAGKEETPAEPKIIGTIEDLCILAKECAVFSIGHNAEPDTVDLLEELEIVNEIAQLVDDNTYNCVCQYMIRCVNLLPPPDDISLQTAHKIYTLIEWLQTPSENPDEEIDMEEEFPEDLQEYLSNTRMSTRFRDFDKELGITDPKSLEDVMVTEHIGKCRFRLWESGGFMNTFVNAGFSNDKLMVEAEEGNSWVYKNKEHGMLSATVLLGLSLLWDTNLGLSHVDKYTNWCTPRHRYFEQWYILVFLDCVLTLY
ncbi:hypothetical protein K438DRAFT_1901960 [Mycena galopus ATCC 62051]|nr:hypothetical protein K438DRAFT_1901960 [Mycena galopus ATCC 62051]